FPTWFERASMLVILLNCVTLGMFHPCEDSHCDSERCKILEDFDDFIFAFFAVEMVIKMVALGIFGKKCYLGDTWNRLDFFIVLAGMLEYSLNLQNVSFSAVRTVRVLRPLRAINRVPMGLVFPLLLSVGTPMSLYLLLVNPSKNWLAAPLSDSGSVGNRRELVGFLSVGLLCHLFEWVVGGFGTTVHCAWCIVCMFKPHPPLALRDYKLWRS
ncbi:voltage-dependent T-type calcium channel subunit alpha-1G-like, partial [Garra rufa]|uniref:voltage-dependent T-type calcium channel subunit alpha-1G-like n=1 Tax=Garra rufa TaxID=137080 RepID=UPI003CCE5EB3